jgi:tight adherence protein C
MTSVVFLGLLAGLGSVGAWIGLRASLPSLGAIERVGTLPPPPSAPILGERGRIGRLAAPRLDRQLADRLQRLPWWPSLSSAFDITGTTPDQLAGRVITGVGVGALLPPVLCGVAVILGFSVPLLAPILLAAALIPLGALWPFAVLDSKAKDRRRHVRIVISTYVDLVVLSLAGGVGVEGALLAAAEVSQDWAARRIAKELTLARDSGLPAWEVLGVLGKDLGVVELSELSATLQLAGTEGARVRQSLTARSVSLRRHEQAEAESAANAMTERLFLPGAILLLGFLLFIGYPAVNRILAGF